MFDDIKLISQSSIRIVNDDKVIYFDPYLLENSFNNDADYIFITHTHYDHLSIEDIIKIKNNNTKIIGPKDILDKIKSVFSKDNIFLVEPNCNYNCNNIIFETVPAYNINKNFHKKEYDWVGYLLSIDGIKIYVAGDTDNLPELHNIKCDIACVPIGGTYTMDRIEAIELVKSIKPNIAIPIHYKTIVGTVEDAFYFKKELDGIVDVKILME